MATATTGTSPESAARNVINARRKRLAVIDALVLLAVAVFGSYGLAVLEVPGEFVIFAVFGLFVITGWLTKSSDICPFCSHSISILPSEGHFQIPKLSGKVRCCPYCGEDFSSPVVRSAPQGNDAK